MIGGSGTGAAGQTQHGKGGGDGREAHVGGGGFEMIRGLRLTLVGFGVRWR